VDTKALVTGSKLRQLAEDQGVPVSGKQLNDAIYAGLLPERVPGGWWEEDVERLVEVVTLGKSLRPLHRRVIRLRNFRWPTPPEKLRQAMIDTIPSITAPQRKSLALYRVTQLRYGLRTEAQVKRLAIPADWRPLPVNQWQDRFRWPTADEFEAIAGPVYSDEHALRYDPAVSRAGLLDAIPMEELIVLIMTRQLSLPAPFPQLTPEEEAE
jgi:hypothetical protein